MLSYNIPPLGRVSIGRVTLDRAGPPGRANLSRSGCGRGRARRRHRYLVAGLYEREADSWLGDMRGRFFKELRLDVKPAPVLSQ